MSVETALTLLRFLHDAAAMMLWGAFGFLATLVPERLSVALSIRLRLFRSIAVVIAAGATLALLPVVTAGVGAGWRDAIDPGMLSSVLFDTSVGTAWMIQAAALVLLVATMMAPAPRRTQATMLASALVLASIASGGHAAMDEGVRGILHRGNDALHLLAGGAWLGALLPLLPIMQALAAPAQREEAALALRRFSAAGHVAVALVIATGVVNTVLVLGRWPLDWHSPYQALLAGKIAIVALMTVLAIVNRYGLVPRMARRPGATVRALRLATVIEIALGLAAILAVSIFGLLEPG